jgi:hypothetical protein
MHRDSWPFRSRLEVPMVLAMSGGAVVVNSTVDDGRALDVARWAIGFARASSAASVAGAALAALVAYSLDAYLLSLWKVQATGPAIASLAVGLGPALSLAATSAGMAALARRLALPGPQARTDASCLARSLRVAGLARRLSLIALAALAVFAVPHVLWLFGQGLNGLAPDAVAAAWGQAAGAAVLAPFVWLAWWLLGRAGSTLRTIVGPDGQYWWDGEFWHPLAHDSAAERRSPRRRPPAHA